MKKYLTNLFTEPDNQTFCPVRLLAIAGVVQFLILAAMHRHTFDPQTYAIGFAAIIGGVGAALGFKKDTPVQQ